MSSNPEESNKRNMPPSSRRPHNLANTPRPSPQPILPRQSLDAQASASISRNPTSGFGMLVPPLVKKIPPNVVPSNGPSYGHLPISTPTLLPTKAHESIPAALELKVVEPTSLRERIQQSAHASPSSVISKPNTTDLQRSFQNPNISNSNITNEDQNIEKAIDTNLTDSNVDVSIPHSVVADLANQNIQPIDQAATIAKTTPNISNPIDQNTPEWEAARQSVLSQMVTSQDIVATPAPKVTRGGVKTGGRRGRGGRRTKIKIERPESAHGITDVDPIQTPESSTRGRMVNRGGRPRGSRTGVNRGGRPRGSRAANNGAAFPGRGRGGGSKAKKKRKRADDDDDEDGRVGSDSSEEPTLLPTQSRSGRRITQASTFSPVVIDLENSTAKRKVSQMTGPTDPPLTVSKRPSKRRRPGETAVCTNCGRGHSPLSNMIVFCDGCNTPWHQYCHDRPITPSVIINEEKEWHCADCEVLREERAHTAGKVSAEGMGKGIKEKRAYLRGLEKAELISLLLHASSLHADLPIFTPPSPELHAPVPVLAAPVTANPLPPEEEEVYEAYVEPDPLPYPKAGNGILLPPENEDLELLVDEDVVTYSHSWVGAGGWEGPGGMRWPLGGPGIGGMSSIPVNVGA